MNNMYVTLLLFIEKEVSNRISTKFTPVSLAQANLSDPQIQVSGKIKSGNVYSFDLSSDAVAPWTWIDHPAGTVGYFADDATGLPSNG